MKYKILIVEDEPLLSAALRKKIEALRPEWNIDNELRTVADTVEWINTHPEPALIFMDIQLADGICFSIFEQVHITNKGIVFTTAYDKYAIEAFDANSIAYLLKPVKTEDLKKVFKKLEDIRDTISKEFIPDTPPVDYSELAEKVSQAQNKYRKRFRINGSDGFKYVPANDIAFFSVEEKLTMATTFKQKKHIIDSTLSEVEEELDPDVFFRANRQFIVNINAVEKVENYFGNKLVVKLYQPWAPSEKIIVSRTKASSLKQWLDR